MAAFNNLLTKSKRKNVYEHLDLDDNYHAQKRYISERIAVELGVLKLDDSPNPSKNTTEHFHSFNPFLKNIPVNNYKTNMMTDFENAFTTKFSLDLNNNNVPDLMVSAADDSLPSSEEQFESEMQDNPGKDDHITLSAGSRSRSGYGRRIVNSSSPSREASYSFVENLLYKETGDSSMSVLNPYNPGPYADLPISYPSKALILYRPPEAVLMKTREVKDHNDPFNSLRLKIKCILDNGSLVQEEQEKEDPPRLLDTLMSDIVGPHLSSTTTVPPFGREAVHFL